MFDYTIRYVNMETNLIIKEVTVNNLTNLLDIIVHSESFISWLLDFKETSVKLLVLDNDEVIYEWNL